MRLYMKGDYDAIPTLAMLRRSPESMKAQAARLAAMLRRAVPSMTARAVPVEDAVGGGSCPALPLPGWGAAVTGHPAGGAGTLQALLRARDVPILCGAREDTLLLHVRTLRPGDEKEILRAFSGLSSPLSQKTEPGRQYSPALENEP
jgi:L-seryl-tRNA(Ser) seleniumtransferase